MSRFSPYPEYKDSGVEWLGEVPAHWEVKPLKRAIAAVESGTSVNAADVPAAQGELGVLKTSCVYKGWFDWRENKTVNQEDLGRVSCPLRKNTLIVSRMNTPELVGSAGLVLEAPVGIFLPDRLWQVSLEESCSPKYYYFFTRTPAYRDQVKVACAGTSSSMQNLGQDEFGGIWHPSPPKQEQHTIAAFLDHETARIDALVEEQQRLIELLKEKRQAMISHAVTKGLDPDVTMKDSGVEWLGKVPAHWIVAPIKMFFSFLDGKRIPLKSEDRGGRQGEFPYYGASGVIDWIDDFIFDQDHVLVSEDGANLLARSSPIAFVATGRYWVNNHAHILEPIDANLEYWAEVIENLDLSIHVTGSAQPKLTSEALGSIAVATPPSSDERLRIQEKITEADKVAKELIKEAVDGIKLLQERRSALISAAVTGKIDVRGWQADQQSEQPEILMAAETRATYG